AEHGHRLPDPFRLETQMRVDHEESLRVLRLEPRGTGKSVPVLSPPGEGLSSLASRVPVELSGIHVLGVLYTPGDLTIEGRPRMYGALVVGGKVTQASEVSGQLEIWYTYELRSGLVQGIPLVYVAPGTWVEKY
ncbi:MAG: hypothetical protein ACREIO_07360, partial [Nitrospiraceae bacterium]